MLNKSKIVESLAEQYPHYSAELLVKVVESFFNELSAAIICGDKVEIRGFGSIFLRFIKRQEIAELKVTAVWRPSGPLLDRLNQA